MRFTLRAFMSAEILFIYDTHCPWSYAATTLVTEIKQALPHMPIQLLHNGYFDGESQVSKESINAVKAESNVDISPSYLNSLSVPKDSTLTANLMTWAQNKCPEQALALLQAIQELHFVKGNACQRAEDIEAIISALKLSPGGKALRHDKLSKDAQTNINDIYELQEFIGTHAIPAILLANNDNLTLLNHNLYLATPEFIVDAIKQELAK